MLGNHECFSEDWYGETSAGRVFIGASLSNSNVLCKHYLLVFLLHYIQMEQNTGLCKNVN